MPRPTLDDKADAEKVEKYKIVVFALNDGFGPSRVISLRHPEDRGLSQDIAISRAARYFNAGFKVAHHHGGGVTTYRPVSVVVELDKGKGEEE